MIICRCKEVTLNEVKAYLRNHPNATITEVKEYSGASTSCGRCSNLLQKIYENNKNDLPKNDQLSFSFQD